MSAARKTTALARRKQPDFAGRLARLTAKVNRLQVARSTPEVLPAVALERTLTEDPSFGALGLQPLELSEKAEAVLAEPVDPAKILILPSGAVYLSHIEYTRWFNRAFGRGAWTLVPVTKPKLTPIENRDTEHLATQTFTLFVHGKPVAQATGEQRYYSDNSDQSLADVLEALNASALRRVAKRLGVGLELWDRGFGRQWQLEHAVRVKVSGKKRPQWRRKLDPPFYGEAGVWTDREPEPRGDSEERPAREPQRTDTRPITDAQRQRLYAIASRAGRKQEEVKGYLRIRWGVESSKDITRQHYDRIVEDIQKPGPLGAVAVDDREPGEEG